MLGHGYVSYSGGPVSKDSVGLTLTAVVVRLSKTVFFKSSHRQTSCKSYTEHPGRPSRGCVGLPRVNGGR